MIPSLPDLPRPWEREGLQRKPGVAKFHAGMATALRSGEMESTSRFLEMEVKVERSEEWEGRQKKKINLTSGTDYFW